MATGGKKSGKSTSTPDGKKNPTLRDLDPDGPLPKEILPNKKGENGQYDDEDRQDYRSRRRQLAALIGHQTRARNNLIKAVETWEADKNASASADIRRCLKNLDDREAKIEDSLNSCEDRGLPTEEWEAAIEKATIENTEARNKAAKALEEYELAKATRANEAKAQTIEVKSVDNGLKPWTLKSDATAVEYHNWLGRFEGFIDKNNILKMPKTAQYSYLLSNVDRQLQELIETLGNKTMVLWKRFNQFEPDTLKGIIDQHFIDKWPIFKRRVDYFQLEPCKLKDMSFSKYLNILRTTAESAQLQQMTYDELLVQGAIKGASLIPKLQEKFRDAGTHIDPNNPLTYNITFDDIVRETKKYEMWQTNTKSANKAASSSSNNPNEGSAKAVHESRRSRNNHRSKSQGRGRSRSRSRGRGRGHGDKGREKSRGKNEKCKHCGKNWQKDHLKECKAIICKLCGQKGHIRPFCTKNGQEGRSRDGNVLIDTSINALDTLDTFYEVEDDENISTFNLFPMDEISLIDKINGKTVKYKDLMADKSRVSKEFVDNIIRYSRNRSKGIINDESNPRFNPKTMWARRNPVSNRIAVEIAPQYGDGETYIEDEALPDTGASKSLKNTKAAKALGYEVYKGLTTPRRLICANGSIMNVDGQIDIKIRFEGREIEVPVVCTNDIGENEFIISCDDMKKLGIIPQSFPYPPSGDEITDEVADSPRNDEKCNKKGNDKNDPPPLRP